MAFFNPSKRSLFDPFRKKWVMSSPEEQVRQALLTRMVKFLGYPKSSLAVEQKVEGSANRRLDIICYTKEGKPLLLVECKASLLNECAKNQVIGYNASIKAPYVCLAARDGVLTGVSEAGEWHFFDGLPTYPSLLGSLGC